MRRLPTQHRSVYPACRIDLDPELTKQMGVYAYEDRPVFRFRNHALSLRVARIDTSGSGAGANGQFTRVTRDRPEKSCGKQRKEVTAYAGIDHSPHIDFAGATWFTPYEGSTDSSYCLFYEEVYPHARIDPTDFPCLIVVAPHARIDLRACPGTTRAKVYRSGIDLVGKERSRWYQFTRMLEDRP